MDDIKKTIGEKIKRRRRELKITQNQMAEKLGITRGYYIHWEKGTRSITSSQLFKIAQALNVDVSYFYDSPQKTNDISLSDKIQNARKEQSITQAELAADLGISRSYLLQLEAGDKNIKATQLIQLAQLLGIDLSYHSNQSEEKLQNDLIGAAHAFFSADRIKDDAKDRVFRDIMRFYLRSKDV